MLMCISTLVTLFENLEVLAFTNGRALHSSSSSSCDLSSLGTSGGVTTDGTGVTHVLLVTTTVRMLNGVHGYTSNGRPGVALDAELVPSTASLQHRLVGTPPTGNNANHGTALVNKGLLGPGRKADSGHSAVGVLGHDDSVVSGSTDHLSAVTSGLLDVADASSLGDLRQRKNVSNGDLGLLSLKDELSSIHTLRGSHQNILPLVSVGILELHLGDRSSSAGLVHQISNNALDVSVALGEVELVHLDTANTPVCVRGENTSLSLTLRTNNLSHLE